MDQSVRGLARTGRMQRVRCMNARPTAACRSTRRASAARHRNRSHQTLQRGDTKMNENRIIARARWITVRPWERAVVLRSGALDRTADAGRHRRRRHEVWHIVDLRPRWLTLATQEVLTADGLQVRVTPVALYRIVDPAAWLTEADQPTVGAVHAGAARPARGPDGQGAGRGARRARRPARRGAQRSSRRARPVSARSSWSSASATSRSRRSSAPRSRRRRVPRRRVARSSSVLERTRRPCAPWRTPPRCSRRTRLFWSCVPSTRPVLAVSSSSGSATPARSS